MAFTIEPMPEWVGCTGVTIYDPDQAVGLAGPHPETGTFLLVASTDDGITRVEVTREEVVAFVKAEAELLGLKVEEG